MEPLRSEYARSKIRGVPFKERGKYLYLWEYERWALRGPNGFADALYFHDAVRNTVEFCKIKDELRPGWREEEKRRQERERQREECEDAAWRARRRQEIEQEREAWSASGGEG